MKTFDVIVIGLGGMGSAALYHLAARGLRVLGIEQFDIGHDRGSSHGETRIIRRAYFEDTAYVPLLHQTYHLWNRLECESGQSLICRCGLIIFGTDRSGILAGVRRSRDAHGLNIDDLTATDVRRRFCMFSIDDGLGAVYEADAGFLRVEACVRTHVEMATKLGAQIVTGQSVQSWRACAGQVSVNTASGRYEAGSLVLCPGAWARNLLGELNLPLRIRRKVVLWYPANDSRMTPVSGCPVFAFDEAGRFLYGFPALAGAVKVAEHTGIDELAHPARLDRAVHPGDREPVNAFVRHRLPLVDSNSCREGTCMYTMTPDEHFVVDYHPAHANVVFACGFSGHGFKFAPVVGSLLAQLTTRSETAQVAQMWSLARPGLSK